MKDTLNLEQIQHRASSYLTIILAVTNLDWLNLNFSILMYLFELQAILFAAKSINNQSNITNCM